MRKYNLKNNKVRNAGAIAALAFLYVFMAACGKKQENPGEVPGVTDTPGVTVITTSTPTNTVGLAPTELVVTPESTPTAMPTDTLTATPTDTPTEIPTKTPTPVSGDAADLLQQHESQINSEKYKEMYALFSDEKYAFPVISITTLDSAPVYKTASTVACVVDTLNCAEGYRLSETAQIRVRGNSSAAPQSGTFTDASREKYPYESYPYKIKFDSKQNLFGLNSGNNFKDWVLLETSSARPYDNIYAFTLARTLHGGRYYVSDSLLVHVYLNGTYMGMYTLCEQCEAKKNRVNVNEPEEGYTGTDIGYFLEIDNYGNPRQSGVVNITHQYATVTDIQGMTRTFHSRPVTIHSDITCDDQEKFIESYIENVFKIVLEAVENRKYYMFDENWKLVDATGVYNNPKDCIGAVMDLDSVVYSYLVEEITMDYDRGEGSFYMAVDFSDKSVYKKLTFLCPWDFEWGYFAPAFFQNNEYELLAGAFDYKADTFEDRANYWFVLLMKEDWFRDMVREKWSVFYNGGAYENMVAKLYALSERGDADRKLANSFAKINTVQKIISLGSYNNVVILGDKRIKWLNDNWFGSGVVR